MPGYIKKAWDFANKTPQPISDAADKFANYITTPKLDESKGWAMTKGFLGGAAQGLASQATPLNAASLAMPAMKGLGGISTGATAENVATPLVNNIKRGYTALGGGPARFMPQSVKNVSKLEQIPTIRHYWDAMDMGQDSATAMRNVAKTGPEMGALIDYKNAGDTARSGMRAVRDNTGNFVAPSGHGNIQNPRLLEEYKAWLASGGMR